MGFFDGFSSRRKADSGALQKRDSAACRRLKKIRLGGRTGDPGTAAIGRASRH
jgi:hypothetical protein